MIKTGKSICCHDVVVKVNNNNIYIVLYGCILLISLLTSMSQNTVQQLPSQTVKLITSTQIITSVATTVKELIENSIDAGAKVIQVRLENCGLDLIEIKDDGSGVSYDNVQKMFLPGYTSKIRQFEDLEKLYSYGFRGEALAAICKIAKVSITTKTKLDTLAMTYEIDSTGVPVSSKPSHINNGTVISVSNLFSNVPVRRLFLSSKKKMSDELKKTEHVVQSLSLIHPELTISLIHNKCPIWRKNSVKGIKQSFMQVAGLRTVSKMEYLNNFTNQVSVDLIVPKKNLESADCIFTNSRTSMYTYVNKRPVECKILSQPVQEHVFHHYTNLNITSKYAVCLVSVEISPQQMDINLEPNKTKVLLKNQLDLIKIIDELLKNYYGHDNFSSSGLTACLNESVIDDETEKQSTKRPRLTPCDKSVGEKRTEEFKDRNKDWDIEIINDDCAVNTNLKPADVFQIDNSPPADSLHPQSLCSQINSNNCVLTREEMSDFNTKYNETNHPLLISTNISNSETRLIDRKDIQSKTSEKPILNEWPCRPKLVISTQPTISQFGVSLNKTENKSVEKMEENKKRTEIENKAVEDIAEEIEKSAEEWSNEMLKAMKFERNNETSQDVLDEDVNQFDLSLQSISSQLGKKEMKAFTKFARIMRPKISEEFPNIKFIQIAGILADRWKALTTDEVKYYEKMSEVIDINRKIHQETKANDEMKNIPKPPDKPKKSPIPKTKNLKSMLENMKKKNRILRPVRQEISMPASFDAVKKLQKTQEPQTPECDIQIIGKLHPSGNWLYVKGSEIGHIRHQGLKELIVFQKMLNSFSLSKKKLEKYILVNEETLGTVLWNVLISLDCELESGNFVITSDVIVKNGFSIEISKNGDIITHANITELADCIPHYGISELKDALRLYQKNGEFGGLASWRPTAVTNYITNEAVRIAEEALRPPDQEEIEDMMNTYHLCFRHLPPLCLHSKEIFPTFYNTSVNIQKIKT